MTDRNQTLATDDVRPCGLAVTSGSAFSCYELNQHDPAIFGRYCFDRENNLVERGMAAEYEGRVYVVGYAGRSLMERNAVVCLDGLNADGRRERVFLSGLRLRLLRLLGYQLPLRFS